eukprot:gene12746-21599_t
MWLCVMSWETTENSASSPGIGDWWRTRRCRAARAVVGTARLAAARSATERIDIANGGATHGKRRRHRGARC